MGRSTELPSGMLRRPFHTSEGAARGLTQGRMRGRDLARPFAGVRISANVVLTHFLRCAALATRLAAEHAFSHTTAAALWGLPLPDDEDDLRPLHVTGFDGRQPPRMPGVIGHRTWDGTIRRIDAAGLPVVDAESTWLQLGAMLSFEDLVACGDALIRSPRHYTERPALSSIDGLARRLESFNGRGKAALREALPLIRDGSESRRETHLRLPLLRGGLPEPELNVDVRDDDGRFIGRGDMVYRGAKVLVEYDGDHHRTDIDQYERDQSRIERFQRAGWITVRVRRRGLAITPDETLERVRSALASRGDL